MTLREALDVAERRLASAGIDTPRVDAELLLAHVTGTTRSGLYADLERGLAEATDDARRLRKLFASKPNGSSNQSA